MTSNLAAAGVITEDASGPKLEALGCINEAVGVVVVLGDDGTEIFEEGCEEDKIHGGSGDGVVGGVAGGG